MIDRNSTNLGEDFFDNDSDLEFSEEIDFDDPRLKALIDRKLEEAMDSLYGGGRRYTEEEVDEEIEKIISRAEKKLQDKNV